MTSIIRAFIAIELSPDIRQKLDEVERQIQSRAGEPARRAVRWVPVKNIHLTLKFLGDVVADHISQIAAVLEQAAASQASFGLQVGGFGAFPNLYRPRVIWVGSEGGASLSQLHRVVDEGAHKLGYASEPRAFSPHLTLGRVNEHVRGEELAKLVQVLGGIQVGELGKTPVERIHLFQSDLRPGGAVYISLKQFALKKG